MQRKEEEDWDEIERRRPGKIGRALMSYMSRAANYCTYRGGVTSADSQTTPLIGGTTRPAYLKQRRKPQRMQMVAKNHTPHGWHCQLQHHRNPQRLQWYPIYTLGGCYYVV